MKAMGATPPGPSGRPPTRRSFDRSSLWRSKRHGLEAEPVGTLREELDRHFIAYEALRKRVGESHEVVLSRNCPRLGHFELRKTPIGKAAEDRLRIIRRALRS